MHHQSWTTWWWKSPTCKDYLLESENESQKNVEDLVLWSSQHSLSIKQICLEVQKVLQTKELESIPPLSVSLGITHSQTWEMAHTKGKSALRVLILITIVIYIVSTTYDLYTSIDEPLIISKAMWRNDSIK